MANDYNTVLYTGVTSDLKGRIEKHKAGTFGNSFTKRYNVKKLVYFEEFQSINDAIKREKQIKGGSRKMKTDLVEPVNPDWNDLSDDLM